MYTTQKAIPCGDTALTQHCYLSLQVSLDGQEASTKEQVIRTQWWCTV